FLPDEFIKCNLGICALFCNLNFSVTNILVSIPVPFTSPSPCAEWQSPQENSVPGTRTGKNALEPGVRWRISILPAFSRGGMVLNRPVSRGPTPITPQNGS